LHGRLQGTQLDEKDEVRESFYFPSSSPVELDHISTEIICYRGSDNNPKWLDVDPDNFQRLCTVSADTSALPAVRKVRGNSVYYIRDYDIVLSVGRTEMKAQVAWWEDGIERRGLANIVYSTH